MHQIPDADLNSGEKTDRTLEQQLICDADAQLIEVDLKTVDRYQQAEIFFDVQMRANLESDLNIGEQCSHVL